MQTFNCFEEQSHTWHFLNCCALLLISMSQLCRHFCWSFKKRLKVNCILHRTATPAINRMRVKTKPGWRDTEELSLRTLARITLCSKDTTWHRHQLPLGRVLAVQWKMALTFTNVTSLLREVLTHSAAHNSNRSKRHISKKIFFFYFILQWHSAGSRPAVMNFLPKRICKFHLHF